MNKKKPAGCKCQFWGIQGENRDTTFCPLHKRPPKIEELFFSFPPTIFSDLNDSESQINHVLSEAAEVANAENQFEEELELVDLTHSLETYWRIKLREHGKPHVMSLFEKVRLKNQTRKYYEDMGNK
ncbi:MAG: hypothetical protein L3J63_06860 [Geopsychrobacter sp.]|nr:hypothetical protein [Geopsychrobacter sp.]